MKVSRNKKVTLLDNDFHECNAHKQRSVASSIRGRVIRSRSRFWHPDDFEGSRDAVELALSRLVKGGELIHIRRGLYWKGKKTRFGMTGPPPFDVAVELTGKDGVGPARWSATLALGLSHQVPRHEIIAVPGRPPTSVPGVSFVNRSARHGRKSERLVPLEVAFLETLEGWDRYVELGENDAARRLIDLVKSKSVRPERLARAADSEPASTRRRLRDILAAAGFHDESSKIKRVSPGVEMSAGIALA